ncbi:hypothetical protein Ahy_A07g035267 [Arachis hypogaea]|uniref:Photosystem II cytochrome b559 N-terminal domain-containing protein n=1 Tax=Arachis hypogaea TaxID=3818 RepID=A0A445CDG9_ARAHY|nr:hypothetical protein Ahy_A07g035267 [Arachis hypogaea]
MWSSTCLEALENVLFLILLPLFDAGLFIALPYPPDSLQEAPMTIDRTYQIFTVQWLAIHGVVVPTVSF